MCIHRRIGAARFAGAAAGEQPLSENMRGAKTPWSVT